MSTIEPLESAGPAVSRQVHGATRAYLLLAFTMAGWGGNVVAARLAVGEVSPMVIISARWAIVASCLAAITSRQLIDALPEIKRDWPRILAMAACGFSAFNALFYVAAHYTSGVNIAILQGTVPIFVVLGTVVLHRARVGPIEAVGIAATLVGVAEIATAGRLAAITGLRFNLGDVLMLVAGVLYAGYTLGLARRPRVANLVFFSAMAMMAFLTSLPLLGYEIATATVQWPTLKGWAIIAFIAVFPSFLSQLAFMRAVQLIGPGRAGLFANLVPVFGAFLAVAILGEPLAPHHIVGLCLVIGGIFAAETAGRARARMDAREAIARERS
jgi:drug/metabolite transporter (DMT)-like permease